MFYEQCRDNSSNLSSKPIEFENYTTEDKKSKFFVWLDRFCNWFLDWSYPRIEPEIRHKRDRFGNEWWYVYDPATGETAHLGSEDEVRIWLDRSYTGRGKNFPDYN